MNRIEIFKRLGMKKHAAEVYEVILRKGPVSATQVVLLAKLHRPAVYRALEELSDRGLIFRSPQGKRFVWNAANPARVEELFREAVDVVHKVTSNGISKNPHKHKTEEVISSTLRLFHGPLGIRSIFDDVISHSKKGERFYRYTSETDLDTVNSYLAKDYRARRDAKKLERQVISNPISGKRKSPRLERFIKFIPPEVDLFDQNVIEIIYGSRVAFIDLTSKEGLILENARLADFQKVIFRQLYKKL